MVLRVASIDEEQYTEAEAREEFAASTARENGRPASQHDSSGNSSSSSSSNSSGSNGSGQELNQEPATGSRSSSEPFRLDTGRLAKLNGLTADEVFTSGIISSAQARLTATTDDSVSPTVSLQCDGRLDALAAPLYKASGSRQSCSEHTENKPKLR